MYKVRTTKTGSGSVGVQVVDRYCHKTRIVKHVGSARDKYELERLIQIGKNLSEKLSPDRPLFPEMYGGDKDEIVDINKIKVLPGHKHGFAYEFLSYFYHKVGFDILRLNTFKHLVIARIIKPSSKIESLNVLKKRFDIRHGHSNLYRELKNINKKKSAIESIAADFAKKNFSFDFSLVFYDVTTMYFETSNEDKEGFRKQGYSKDGKHQQPQILVGLVVTKEGFPISVETFNGNTFEGHTILPVILNIKKKYGIKKLTVVADAGMLSFNNMSLLEQNGVGYVVGARMGSMKECEIKDISEKIGKREGFILETATQYGRLIVDYSRKRAIKDMSDRKKQIEKAKRYIGVEHVTKRMRFLIPDIKARYKINLELIEKDILLDGLKGYYTNTEDVATLLIERYKDLWHVEKSFRIAKSDLLARPMFHHKKENINAHTMIVFAGLCMSKLIEIDTRMTVKKVAEDIMDVIDVTFENPLTGNKFVKRTETTENPLRVYVDKYNKLSNLEY